LFVPVRRPRVLSLTKQACRRMTSVMFMLRQGSARTEAIACSQQPFSIALENNKKPIKNNRLVKKHINTREKAVIARE